MDNQLLITWAFMIVIALGIDIGMYVFLRLDWKKNGSTLIDRFWNQLFDKMDQFFKKLQKSVAVALVKYHQASITPDAKPFSQLEPEPVAPDVVPIEIIPVSVKNIGSVRRVQFSLDMPLDTQVEVRIGATREAGVKVEKREL